MVFGTLGEVQEYHSTRPWPNPADGTHLEFSFEQPENMQRCFREETGRHTRTSQVRLCDTGRRDTGSMQTHQVVYLFAASLVFIKQCFSKHFQCYYIMLSSTTTCEGGRVGFIIPIVKKLQGS